LVKTAREGLERPGPADDGAVALRDHEAGCLLEERQRRRREEPVSAHLRAHDSAARELECERAGIGDAPRHDQGLAVLAGIMQMPGRRRALTKL
jgi:hypothetical protein